MQYGIIFVQKKKTHIRDLEEKWRQKLGHEKVLEEICEQLAEALGPDTKSSLTKSMAKAAKQPAKWFQAAALLAENSQLDTKDMTHVGQNQDT